LEDDVSEVADFFGNLLDVEDDAVGNFFLGFSFCCPAEEADGLLEVGAVDEEDAASFMTTSCCCCFGLFDFVGNIGFLAVPADDLVAKEPSAFLNEASLPFVGRFLEMGVGPEATTGFLDAIGFTDICF
jgi:hypothetical protein